MSQFVNMTTCILFVVIFCVFGVSGKIPSTDLVKPGCVPPNPDIRCFRFDDQCKSNDANCKSDEICCEKACGTSCVKPVCDLQKEVVQCQPEGRRPRSSWYYNKKTDSCLPYGYGQCGGNANSFTSLEDCNKVKTACACRLPSLEGPCKAREERYFYNKKTGLCEKFYYGGCRGNKNNFKTLQECKRTCGEHPPRSTDQVTCEKGSPLPNKCDLGPGSTSTPCPKGYYCFNSPSGGSACCQIPCKYGNPHETLSCGMVIGSNKCPRGYHCIGGPADEYFACCPDAKKG